MAVINVVDGASVGGGSTNTNHIGFSPGNTTFDWIPKAGMAITGHWRAKTEIESYPYPFVILVHIKHSNGTDFMFDVQDVGNQSGWTGAATPAAKLKAALDGVAAMCADAYNA